MTTMLTVFCVLAVLFAPGLIFTCYVMWLYYRDAQEYNDEHDLP